MPRYVASCVLACCLFAHLTARADITVEGTVYYWNGDVENADKTTGA